MKRKRKRKPEEPLPDLAAKVEATLVADNPETGENRAVLFALAYVRNNCQGVRAARIAGYKGTPAELATAASTLLRTPKVQRVLAQVRHEMTMDALEALQRMSDMARGTMADFLDVHGRIDLAKARRKKKLHLLKSVKEKEVTTTNLEGGTETRIERYVELYPADGALRTMMQFLGLLESARRDIPKDDRELDAMLVAELIRVKGTLQGEAVARAMGLLPPALPAAPTVN